VFPLRRLSADDVISDAVIHFRLSVDVPSGAARNAFVYFRFRVGNATTQSFRWQFGRRENPLRAEECLQVRVLDAVGGREQLRPGAELTVFVRLSASVGRHQLPLRHRRRQRRRAEPISIRVMTGHVSPFLTIAIREDNCNPSLWDLPTAPLLP